MNKILTVIFGGLVALALLGGTAFAADQSQANQDAVVGASQSTPASPSPSALVAEWDGSWSSSRYSSSNGLQIQVDQDDGQEVRGKMKWTTRGGMCSYNWEPFVGNKKGEEVYAQVDLGGRCGKVNVLFLLDPERKNAITGTYSAEYPDYGSIRLTKKTR